MRHAGRHGKRSGAWRATPHSAQIAPSDQDVLIRLAALRDARQRGDVVADTAGVATAPTSTRRTWVIAVVIALLPIAVGLAMLATGLEEQRPLAW